MLKWHSFYLRKLYLDCIDDQGNCLVIYWANLKLFFFDLVYSSVLFSDPRNQLHEKSSLRRVRQSLEDQTITLDLPALGISGTWKADSPPVESVLYTSSEGESVCWRCHQPRSVTEIVFRDQILRGYGYAETLVLPVAPWRLPIGELRWGRFLSPNHTVIWINWRGPYPLNQLWHNGRLFTDAVFLDDHIKFANDVCQVRFLQKQIVREGTLSRVLSRMPWLRLFVRRSFLNTIELKFKSRASFNDVEGKQEEGWSLFEIVRWNTKR